MAEPAVYNPKRGKMFGLLAICAVFVAISLWMLLGGITGGARSALAPFVGGAGLLIFGLAGAAFVKRLLDPAPSLVIEETGLVLGSPKNPEALRLSWEEITGVGVFEVSRQKMMGIEVADPMTVRGRMSRFQQLAATGNAKMGYPIVSVAQSAVDAPLEEIEDRIREELVRRR